MHKFERFIIYPLLIVALFYNFAGEQVTTVAQDVIDKLIVREISVVNHSGEEAINVNSGIISGNGVISLKNPSSDDEYSIISAGGVSSYDGQTISRMYPDGFRITHDTDNFPREEIIYIGAINLSGHALFNNSNEDLRVYIGANTEGHGLINVYDKYGDDWASYGFKSQP